MHWKKTYVILPLFILSHVMYAPAATDMRKPLEPPRIAIALDKIQTRLHVAPNGNDNWSGKLAKPSADGKDGPFATLPRARDEVRKLRAAGLPPGGVAVMIAQGDYVLDKTLEFTAGDSGTADAPVIYAAVDNGTVRLLGGRELKAADFQPVPDSVKRIHPNAVGKVVRASCEALKLTHAGPYPNVFSDGGGIFEFFHLGKRMPLARWPKSGATSMMKKAVVNGDAKTPGVFEYREDEPARWSPESGLWLKGQWRVGWEDPAIKVAKIDAQKKEITFAAGINAGIGSKYLRPSGNGKEPWFALNVLEELSQPGEWALDFHEQMLYFWPPEPLKDGQVSVSQLDKPMIALDGASNLAFIGLTLEVSLGDGIEVKNGKRNLIAGCTLRNLAKRGAVVHGEGNGIQSCDMYNLGEGCILLSGGDRGAIRHANNYAVNNHLHHYGVLKNQYSAALEFGLNSAYAKSPGDCVGNYAAHNLVHHAPRDAVLFGGVDNIFEYNEFHNCGYNTADAGVFYSWLDWTIRGIIIRYNYMHDTLGGVNPDDGASGCTVYGNIFKGDRVGVWVASGPDHNFQYNIFIKEQGAVFAIDDRGVGRKYATNNRLINRVKEVNPDQPPWSARFPEMANMLSKEPERPWRTVFSNNVVWTKSSETYMIKLSPAVKAKPGILTIENNFITAQNPGFVNASANNYALKKESPVFQKIPGFPDIPFEKMGLVIDEFRGKLPSDEEAGRNAPVFKNTDKDKNFGT